MIIRANIATPDILLGNDGSFEDNLKEVFDQTRDQNSIYYIESEYVAFRYHLHVLSLNIYCFILGYLNV